MGAAAHPRPGADVHLEAPVDRQVAPVRVVAAQNLRPLVVLLRADGLGDDASTGRRRRRPPLARSVTRLAALAVAANADDTVVVDHDVFDRELFAHLGAGFGRRVDEQLVEHGAPRAVRERRFGGARRARDREWARSRRRRCRSADSRLRSAGRAGPTASMPPPPAGEGRASTPCRWETSPGRRREPCSPSAQGATQSESLRNGRPRRLRRTAVVTRLLLSVPHPGWRSAAEVANALLQEGGVRMLTARATTSTRVTTEISDCVSIVSFAQRVMGITSVGLNAIAFVNDT